MNVKTLKKRLGVKSLQQVADLIGVTPGTFYTWPNQEIPAKYMDKVHQALADKANNLPMVIEQPSKAKSAVVFQEVKVRRPSKVAIAIMDSEEAQSFLDKFMSGEVG